MHAEAELLSPKTGTAHTISSLNSRTTPAPRPCTSPVHLPIAVDDDTFRMRSQAIAPTLPCEGPSPEEYFAVCLRRVPTHAAPHAASHSPHALARLPHTRLLPHAHRTTRASL
jgi:hypothetical protein